MFTPLERLQIQFAKNQLQDLKRFKHSFEQTEYLQKKKEFEARIKSIKDKAYERCL